MSTSEKTEFDEWFASFYSSTGDMTMLVILATIGESSVAPLCSTYFHVIGNDLDWDDLSLMFVGSGQPWDGAAFFPTKAANGGPVDNPTARLRMRELETKVTENRMTLNEGYFFDKEGRKIKIEPIAET